MNNLLGDIPQWAIDAADDSSQDEVVGDVEQGKTKKKKLTMMNHFFNEVDGIKADIEAVAEASKEIGRINEQAMLARTTKEEDKLSKKLKSVINTINKRAKQTKTMLGLLKEETGKLEKAKNTNSSDIRWVPTADFHFSRIR